MGQNNEGLKTVTRWATAGALLAVGLDIYKDPSNNIITYTSNQVFGKPLVANSNQQMSPEVLAAVSSPTLERMVAMATIQPYIESTSVPILEETEAKEPEPTDTVSEVNISEQKPAPTATPKPVQSKPSTAPAKPTVVPVQSIATEARANKPEPVINPNIIPPTPKPADPVVSESITKPKSAEPTPVPPTAIPEKPAITANIGDPRPNSLRINQQPTLAPQFNTGRLLNKLCGTATYYHPSLHGNPMANGEPYNRFNPTIAAFMDAPFETVLKVIHERQAASFKVKDRGKFKGVNGGVIDLSEAGFQQFTSLRTGRIDVCVEW